MSRTLLEPEQAQKTELVPRLRKQLEREYEQVSDEQIDQVAKHSLQRFSAHESRSSCRCLLGGTLGIISDDSSRYFVRVGVTRQSRGRHQGSVACGAMSPSMVVADCPECRGVGTVILGTCQVCFAEFYEDDHDDRAYFSHGGSHPLSPIPPGAVSAPSLAVADLSVDRILPRTPSPEEKPTEDVDTPRGIVTGVFLSLSIWLLIGALVWWFRT
jgi:hypothetical protein